MLVSLSVVDYRLKRFLSRLPSSLAEVVKRYFRHWRKRVGHQAMGGRRLPPYWKPLPLWLAGKYFSRRDLRNSLLFLRDVLWGQYALLLFIRMQDDVFDRQTDSPLLLYAADQFFFEAERCFLRHFAGGSIFWKHYHRALEETTRAIVEVDRLQQLKRTKPDTLLEGYARVSSVFKIGAAAVCDRVDQRDEFARISRFCDEMAKAGQILDDINDVDEDTQRGRWNYVSLFSRQLKSLPSLKSSGAEIFLMPQEEFFLRGTVLLEIHSHLGKARSILHSLALQEGLEYLDRYRKKIGSFAF